jgi:hypothetical protein
VNAARLSVGKTMADSQRVIFSHDRYALQIVLLAAVVGWLMSYGVGVAG